MTETVPPGFIEAKNMLADSAPFIWLCQVRVPTDPPTLLRMTANTEAVEWGNDSSGAPIVWEAYPLALGDIQTDTEGGTPETSLTVANMSREVMALLIVHDYFLGQPVIMRLVHQDHLNDPSAVWEIPFEVTGCAADEESVTFALSAQNLYGFTMPNERALRDSCRDTYKDIRCGFTLDPGNVNLGDCPKTLAACTLRGDFEVAAGQARQHPARFGGFPGIPRPPGT
jgi:phage-related protein